MEQQRDPTTRAEESFDDFDLEWEALTFSSALVLGSASVEDWEDRFNEDTSGYVSNPLTTSFTDLDLADARAELRETAEWAELDSWSEASGA